MPNLNTRVRSRRTQLGLTGAQLAQRAGISASYVSLIENGAKTPDDDVAAALARALGDDEALYRAWARGTRLGLRDLELLNRLEIIARTPVLVDLVEGGHELPALEPEAPSSPRSEAWGDIEARLREAASRLSPPPAPSTGEPPPPAGEPSAETSAESSVIAIPVLREGADPGRICPSPTAVVDRLLVDRRLVADHEPTRLFAYDVTTASMRHLRGLAAPRDRIVFRRGGRADPDRICAVRTTRGVVLSRVLVQDRALLLLPGEGERAFESVGLEGRRDLPAALAGTHVLLIRR